MHRFDVTPRYNTRLTRDTVHHDLSSTERLSVVSVLSLNGRSSLFFECVDVLSGYLVQIVIHHYCVESLNSHAYGVVLSNTYSMFTINGVFEICLLNLNKIRVISRLQHDDFDHDDHDQMSTVLSVVTYLISTPLKPKAEY